MEILSELFMSQVEAFPERTRMGPATLAAEQRASPCDAEARWLRYRFLRPGAAAGGPTRDRAATARRPPVRTMRTTPGRRCPSVRA